MYIVYVSYIHVLYSLEKIQYTEKKILRWKHFSEILAVAVRLTDHQKTRQDFQKLHFIYQSQNHRKLKSCVPLKNYYKHAVDDKNTVSVEGRQEYDVVPSHRHMI